MNNLGNLVNQEMESAVDNEPIKLFKEDVTEKTKINHKSIICKPSKLPSIREQREKAGEVQTSNLYLCQFKSERILKTSKLIDYLTKLINVFDDNNDLLIEFNLENIVDNDNDFSLSIRLETQLNVKVFKTKLLNEISRLNDYEYSLTFSFKEIEVVVVESVVEEEVVVDEKNDLSILELLGISSKKINVEQEQETDASERNIKETKIKIHPSILKMIKEIDEKEIEAVGKARVNINELIVEADSKEEALKNAKEVLILTLKGRIKDHEFIPGPMYLRNIKLAENQCIRMIEVYIKVDAVVDTNNNSKIGETDAYVDDLDSVEVDDKKCLKKITEDRFFTYLQYMHDNINVYNKSVRGYSVIADAVGLKKSQARRINEFLIYIGVIGVGEGIKKTFLIKPKTQLLKVDFKCFKSYKQNYKY